MNDPLSPEPGTTPSAGSDPSNQPPSLAGIDGGAIKNESSVAQPAAPGWERATLEKLAFAALEEQRLARRWRNGVRLAWLGFLVVVAWMGFSQNGPTRDVSQPHTAVVEIKGEIASGAEASADAIGASLRAAFEDQGALAVVLLINSPGGSPVQAGIINDEIRRLKAKH